MNAFAGRSDCQRAGLGGAETDKTIDPSPPALRLYRSDGNFTCCADPAVRLSDIGGGGGRPGVRGAGLGLDVRAQRWGRQHAQAKRRRCGGSG